MMRILESFATESFSRLCTALEVTLDDDFGEVHTQLMENTGAYLSTLLKKIGDLLAAAIDTVEAGRVMHKSTLDSRIQEMKQAQEELTTEFVKSCKALNLYRVNDACSSEHVVC